MKYAIFAGAFVVSMTIGILSWFVVAKIFWMVAPPAVCTMPVDKP